MSLYKMAGGTLVALTTEKAGKVVMKSKKQFKKLKKKFKSQARSFRKAFPTYQNPFPDHKSVKITYTQTVSLTPSATLGVIGATQKFSLNGLYDPDITGTGAQAMYRDQLTAIYERYRVKACTVILDIFDPTADGNEIFYRLLNPSNYSNSMAGDSTDVAAQRPNCSYVILNNSGKQRIVKKIHIPIYKACEITKLMFDANPDNYTGGSSGNPGNPCYIELGVGNTRTNTQPSVAIKCTFIYHVMFFQRNIMTSS